MDRKTSSFHNEDTEDAAMRAWTREVVNGTAQEAQAEGKPVRDPSSQPQPTFDQLRSVYGP